MNEWIPNSKILKLFISVAVFVIVIYIIGFCLVLNKIKKVENLSGSAESNLVKEEKINTIKSIAEDNKESIESLREFFIQKGDEVEFIEKIESVGRDTGVKFDIFSIEIDPKNENLQFHEKVVMKINIEGSWKGVVAFILKLEKLPFGVFIENIGLDSKNSGQWSGFINLATFREK